MLPWLGFRQKSLHRSMKDSEVQFIHFFDDEKFVNNAIEIFGYLNVDTPQYFVIKDKYNDDFIHANPKLVEKIVLNQPADYQDLKNHLNGIHGKKAILFHNLTQRKQKVVKMLPDDILLVWFSWGNDVYNAWKPFKYKIYEPNTSRFVFRNFSLKSKLLNLLFFKYGLHKVLGSSSKIYDTPYYKATQKIDISVPVLSSESYYLSKINNKFVYAPFTYGNLNLFTSGITYHDVPKANNILVGNSCTASNNHVEVFKKLSRLNLGNRKVIVPLSYGDRGDYLDFVLKKGKQFLGKNFYPLIDFMPLEAYNKLLFSCSVAIFNHVRQQAVANIIVMGCFGARIFFNQRGMAYKFYKSEGLQVSTLKSLNQHVLETKLTSKELKTNRSVMKKLYAEDAVKDKVRQLYKVIIGHPKLQY